MAQIYKEKVNIELGKEDFEATGKVTLFQNDSSSQFIIQDIIIERGANGYIRNNGVAVAPLGTSSTGSEIVERNGIVEADIVWDGQIYCIQDTNSVLEMGTASGLARSIDTPTMSEPCGFFKTDDYAYYFKYDNNSSTILYRSNIVGGAFGSWNNVNSNSYAFKTFDNNRKKVMWVSGITYYEHDMETQTTVSQNLSAFGMSYNTHTYTQAANVNGWFFYIPENGYDNYCFGYNHEKGIFIRIQGIYDLNENCGLAACYDHIYNRYTVIFRTGSSIFKQEIIQDIDSLTPSQSMQTPSYSGSSGISLDVNIQQIDSRHVMCGTLDGRFLYVGTDEQIYSVNAINPDDQTRIGVAFGISNSYGGLTILDKGEVDIKMKISGIEIR